MKNPDNTKNTSTPTKPPASAGTRAWKSTTRRIATPRSPSMSGRKVGCWPAMVGLRTPDGQSYGGAGLMHCDWRSEQQIGAHELTRVPPERAEDVAAPQLDAGLPSRPRAPGVVRGPADASFD